MLPHECLKIFSFSHFTHLILIFLLVNFIYAINFFINPKGGGGGGRGAQVLQASPLDPPLGHKTLCLANSFKILQIIIGGGHMPPGPPCSAVPEN